MSSHSKSEKSKNLKKSEKRDTIHVLHKHRSGTTHYVFFEKDIPKHVKPILKKIEDDSPLESQEKEELKKALEKNLLYESPVIEVNWPVKSNNLLTPLNVAIIAFAELPSPLFKG